MAMTGIVIYILTMLSGYAVYLFWMGIAAMILIGLQQTGFIALVAKRSILISRDEISINDSEREAIAHKAEEIKNEAEGIQDKLK